ncbi:PREDICTED: RNA/RNP complex-1-interacting phosphatase isoform X2 [Capra hircus]|uniref:RNA/RNP complex-1-interacting phosphatase isoform X2 n=1 Tax=Capra hircus TaxID=9925 RepID=UPI0003AF5C10|nr:PREDICTED: RNA/RNP complex-1-interacting phosphatase isoform X2 [Capra hircus]
MRNRRKSWRCVGCFLGVSGLGSCRHPGLWAGSFCTLGVACAASWGSHEPVASCRWSLGPGSRLFWTFVSQEEGRKPHPRKSFEKHLAPEECFSPLDLFNKIQEQNEELGLIIDLTYTRRYYKPEELPENIPYLKIYTVGHQVPDDDTILKFKTAVNGFLKENKDNDRLIGVHCTHGLNRTGYLICRYLIDVEGMRPDDAIELFNRCRGHCLERQNYIEDLRNGPIRKNWDSSVSRTRGFEDSTRMMEPVFTAAKSVNRRPNYNIHQTQGYPEPRHFHTWTQDLQQSERKFSQNRNIYWRCHVPPPGPPGEDYFQRRYSWNVKPNASQGGPNRRFSPGSYYRVPYSAYYRWTK